MEEGPVLVVLKCIVDLLIPYHASVEWRYVHELDPKGVSDQVVGEHSGALQARVGPSLPVWIGNVELCDGNGVDLVGGLWDRSLDRLLVLVGQD